MPGNAGLEIRPRGTATSARPLMNRTLQGFRNLPTAPSVKRGALPSLMNDGARTFQKAPLPPSIKRPPRLRVQKSTARTSLYARAVVTAIRPAVGAP